MFIQNLNNSGIKWIKEENWHITTLFIGNFPVEKIEMFVSALSNEISAFPVFELEFEKFTLFPYKHPSMIWAKFHDNNQFEQFVNKTEKIAKEFIVKNSLNIQLKTNKKAIPHITLSRLKTKGASLENVDSTVQKPVFLKVKTIRLMKSELLSEGAEYSVLHDFSLSGK